MTTTNALIRALYEAGELSGEDGFSGSHGDLTNVSSDDHHVKTPEYTDSEAMSAINNDGDHGSSASHNYFSGNYGDLSGTNSISPNTASISQVLNMPAKSSTPGSPSQGDIYTDDGTNTSSGNTGFRYYDGSAWVDL